MYEERLLIEELKDGNHLVFTLCYEKYHRGVYAFAIKHTSNPSLAEDIVQHTFMRLWEQRQRLDPGRSLANYIYAISKHHTLDQLRSMSRENACLSNYSSETADRYEPDISKEEKIRAFAQLEASVLSMTPQRQQIFDLKINEGLSNQEIAERLHISVNTVKVLYARIMKQLRLAVKDHRE